MAEDRKSAKKTARRVLADSSNAKHRFGFAGERGSPITLAPKLSDLWFIEFKTVSGSVGTTLDISALAKSVSHISLMTSSQPIDQYGKRIYVPTRVDFPEVTIQMYDTVDGKMFDVAGDIYRKFFKNNDATVNSSNAEDVLTSSNSHGRKLPDENHQYFHQHFEKITVYHFFGNLEKGGPSAPGYTGSGHIQKIELINPLVTSLTFSASDYSISELRTVDMSVQPENVIISNTAQANFPTWMTLGMDYMLDELTGIEKRAADVYPDHFGPSTYGPIKTDGRFKKKAKNDTTAEQDAKNDARKLNELAQLYNIALKNPDSENIEVLTKELKDNIGVIDAARLRKFTKKVGKDRYSRSQEQFLSDTSSNNSNSAILLGPVGSFSSPEFGSAMKAELVSSYLGDRPFNVNNTNNALSGSLVGSNPNSAKLISGSDIEDRMNTPSSTYTANTVTVGNRTTTTSESTVVISQLEMAKAAHLKSKEYSPGVSPAIRDKFK
jgi:hypothetical protein